MPMASKLPCLGLRDQKTGFSFIIKVFFFLIGRKYCHITCITRLFKKKKRRKENKKDDMLAALADNNSALEVCESFARGSLGFLLSKMELMPSLQHCRKT